MRTTWLSDCYYYERPFPFYFKYNICIYTYMFAVVYPRVCYPWWISFENVSCCCDAANVCLCLSTNRKNKNPHRCAAGACMYMLGGLVPRRFAEMAKGNEQLALCAHAQQHAQRFHADFYRIELSTQTHTLSTYIFVQLWCDQRFKVLFKRISHPNCHRDVRRADFVFRNL